MKNTYSLTVLRKRLFAYFCLLAVLILVIIIRLFFVEVVNSNTLQQKAIDQWTRELPVKAKRGNILSSDGKILATSADSFAVFVRTRSVKDSQKVSQILGELFGVDSQSLQQKIDKKGTSEITVKRQVTKNEIIKLTDYNLDGVYYSVDNKRVYPYAEMLCSVLGYTTVDGLGQGGLEKYYNKYLAGIDGEILYEADLLGSDLSSKTPTFIPSVNGLDVVLTIDYEIQLIVESALNKVMHEYTPKGAAAVVLNPQNGQILAMANLPSYDLNNIPRDDIESLNSLSRNGLVVDSYEPGSTFKMVTALANIEESLNGNPNAKPLNYVYNSSRYRQVAGGKIKCWSDHKNGKHQNQTLQEALNNSCNPCFTDIALSLGTETFYKYIKSLNFGKVTGVDFLGEASGMLIPETAVKEGDLARIGFGQSVAVTPLQLAAAASACINGGLYYTPKLVKEIKTSDGKVVEIMKPSTAKRVASKKASQILAEYLENVVTNGSGKQCYIEGYKVGGKTGTAQKFVDGKIAQGKYVMSFVGFFPSNAPKYLCLVTVDEPIGGNYGSTVAAPVVYDIFTNVISAKSIAKQ